MSSLDTGTRQRCVENGKAKRNQTSSDEIENDDVATNVRLRAAMRKNLQESKEDLLRDLDRHFDPNTLMERLWPQKNGFKEEDLNANQVISSRKHQNDLYCRDFVPRHSVLTELMKVKHIATIYNIFVAVLMTLFLSTAIHDLLTTGRVKVGFRLISQSFTGIHIAIIIWMEMMAYTLAIYYIFKCWAKFRSQMGYMQLYLDRIMVVTFILYLLIHMVLPCYQIFRIRLPFALSSAILTEQLRLLMKTYAFLRTNGPRILRKTADEQVPSIEKYLYYLFAPTFIYQDAYPRNDKICWKFACSRFLEMGSIILYMSFVFERYVLPKVECFGKPGVPSAHLLSIIIDNAIPGLIVMVCAFYGILHSWLNGMAEILRFADRRFYQDWWNASDFAQYLKCWNIVVYDWLYTFVYVDIGGRYLESKWSKAFLVIMTSAIFHDYVISCACGYFLPCFIVIYGICGPFLMPLTSRNKVIGNIAMWFSYCIGWGIIVTLFLAEYYARINCPPIEVSPVRDFFVPRTLTCDSLIQISGSQRDAF